MAATGLSISASKEGVLFICGFEGFRPKPYTDPGGLYTIGYGTRITVQQVKEYASGITTEQALALVQIALQDVYKALAKCPFNGLFQYQFDAIISLCYNIGSQAFIDSTIYSHIGTRHWDLTPWKWFIRDQTGRVDAGLIRRREAEMRLFVYGIYK